MAKSKSETRTDKDVGLKSIFCVTEQSIKHGRIKKRERKKKRFTISLIEMAVKAILII